VSQSRLAIDRNELRQLIGYYAVVCGKDPKLKYEVRHSLVQMALSQGIKATARFYQVSRNTVRKWLRRYRESRIVGLEEHSRAPKRIPHRTDAATEAWVVAVKEKRRRFGSRRLKRDFNLPCSHSALDRIYHAHDLIRRRKRKRQRRNDLRAEKARLRPFERTCNDTKHLTDIPEYWPQARLLGLPWFQYSHRDIRTGVMLLGFADELSLSHSTLFAELVIEWYRQHQIDLVGSMWNHDGGSEFIGAWNAKHKSSYQQALTAAKIDGFQIPKTTYNAEVETIHNTIEFEFFEVERFRDRSDFFQKATSYQWWYNCNRKNGYRQDKSPREILEEIAPEIDSHVLLLPAIDLDSALDVKVTCCMANGESAQGGHDVPRPAQPKPEDA
jgi:transposase-like protein